MAVDGACHRAHAGNASARRPEVGGLTRDISSLTAKSRGRPSREALLAQHDHEPELAAPCSPAGRCDLGEHPRTARGGLGAIEHERCGRRTGFVLDANCERRRSIARSASRSSCRPEDGGCVQPGGLVVIDTTRRNLGARGCRHNGVGDASLAGNDAASDGYATKAGTLRSVVRSLWRSASSVRLWVARLRVEAS